MLVRHFTFSFSSSPPHSLLPRHKRQTPRHAYVTSVSSNRSREACLDLCTLRQTRAVRGAGVGGVHQLHEVGHVCGQMASKTSSRFSISDVKVYIQPQPLKDLEQLGAPGGQT